MGVTTMQKLLLGFILSLILITSFSAAVSKISDGRQDSSGKIKGLGNILEKVRNDVASHVRKFRDDVGRVLTSATGGSNTKKIKKFVRFTTESTFKDSFDSSTSRGGKKSIVFTPSPDIVTSERIPLPPPTPRTTSRPRTPVPSLAPVPPSSTTFPPPVTTQPPFSNTIPDGPIPQLSTFSPRIIRTTSIPQASPSSSLSPSPSPSSSSSSSSSSSPHLPSPRFSLNDQLATGSPELVELALTNGRPELLDVLQDANPDNLRVLLTFAEDSLPSK